MGRTKLKLSWPKSALPVVRNGGCFPMQAHNPSLRYFTPQTTALHLHDYAGKMWIDEQMVRLRPGDFTLTPVGIKSRYDLDAPGDHYCVHFELVVSKQSGIKLPLHWRPGVHEHRLREQVQTIIDLRRRSESRRSDLPKTAAGATLQSLLLWVAVVARDSTNAHSSGKSGDKLDRVRQHLDEHFRAPLDVPNLARRFDVSQNYLARLFRERHGMTMQRYLLSNRVELARHLLNTTDMPIKAVAIESGLSNPQYFHRQFRSMTGRSPSAERALGAG